MLNTNKLNAPPVGDILTYNPKTNKTQFLPYTEKSIHTKHGKMYEVRTKRGFSVKVTDDHSLATMGMDNFFMPLKPENAVGKFVPIICYVDYDEELEEQKDPVDISKFTSFSNEVLTLQSEDACALIVLLFNALEGNEDVWEYTAKDKEELNRVLVTLTRNYMPPIKIDGLKVTVDLNHRKDVPEKGKLVPEADVILSNPANTYLQLPYTWDEVVSVTEIPRENITYDFTVPDFPLFIANGILVYDTINNMVVFLRN